MTAYLTKHGDVIQLRIRPESAEWPGGMIGDVVRLIRPGESEFGKTYEEWDAYAPGPVEVGPPPGPRKDGPR